MASNSLKQPKKWKITKKGRKNLKKSQKILKNKTKIKKIIFGQNGEGHVGKWPQIGPEATSSQVQVNCFSTLESEVYYFF